MIRPGQHNEDGLPVELAWKDTDHNEDGLPVLTSKKKDDFPLLYNRAKTGSMAALVDGSHPLSSDGLLKPMTEKAIKKNEYPFDIPADEIKSEAQNKIADIMYGDNEDWKDPLKVIDRGLKESKDVKTALVHSAAKDIAKESLADNGFDAKRILNESIWGKYGDENQTSKMLREKANEYDKKTEGLRKLEPDSGVYPNPATLWDLKSEALKNYAQKDNEFKRNLESSGIDVNNVMAWQQIPSVKMGSIMNDYLNDNDINTYLEKEPTKLFPQFQQAHETLLTDNKDYGVNVVANKVSQAIQESGYNNIEPIFNYNSETSKGFANDVAGRVLTPQELEIYNQNIRDNQEQYLDKPSFFEGVASGIKDVYKGVGSTLEAPFQSHGQNIKDQWVKEASNVSANPEGLMKYIRGAGRGAGFVMGLVSGAEVGGGAPAAHQAMIGATVFGDALKEAETKYKSPVKAWTSAGLQTLGFMYFNNIFPSAKVGQLFNAAKPEINDIAVSLAKGEISQQAAKTGLTKVLESAGKGLKQNVSASAQMTALVGINRMADKLFGLDPQTYEKYNSQSFPSVFGHFFLDNTVVSGLAGHSQASRERKLSEQSLMTAAQSPRQIERAINEQDPANKEELLSTVKHVEEVHKELIKNNVPQKKQGSYLLHSVAEKANKELAEQSSDPTLKAKYTDLAKKSHDIKEGILKGIPEDLIKQNQAIKEIKELYNEDYLPKGSMMLLESKANPEDTKGKFDEEKVKGYLKFVAQQANNITEGGEFNTGFDSRKSAKQIPEVVRDIANEMFPEYKKTAEEYDADKVYEPEKPEGLQSTSVIMPQENKVAENVPLSEGKKPAIILPEENKVADNVPLKQVEEPAKLETERDMEIDNAMKPEIKFEPIPVDDLVESKNDPIGDKGRYRAIKKDFDILNKIIQCIWQ